MGERLVRRATAADAADIARLILLSAEHFLPAVFGPKIAAAVERLAAGRGTLFSHSHAWIAEAGGRVAGTVAGLLLGYSGREKAAEDPATGLWLFRALGFTVIRRLGRLLALRGTIGLLGAEEWYVSNVAVYPEHRGQGVGHVLMAAAEAEAQRAGALSTVLDVETDNAPAIRLYEALGYSVQRTTPPLRLDGHEFAFFRMKKNASRQ